LGLSKKEKSERQERSIISIIKDYASLHNPISIKGKFCLIKKIIGAEKYTKLTVDNKEPLTDIQLLTKNKKYNISAKGEEAPTLGGGGLFGLSKLQPKLVSSFLNEADSWYQTKGFKKGDYGLPDTFYKINKRYIQKIMIGNEGLGGPIDYMYVGPMDVSHEFSDNTLIFNGNFIPIDTYSNQCSFYFRLRKRRKDVHFLPNEKDENGFPYIFSKSPSKGAWGRRITVTNDLPNVCNILN